MTTTRWILAFDAGCSKCRAMSSAAATASGDRVEVLPLGNPEVTQWRISAFGDDPPFVPTLIAVSGTQTRAWTGSRMAFVLARHLGIRRTARVLHALGTTREQDTVALGTDDSAPSFSRKSFMRMAGGFALATAAVAAGASPAAADELSPQMRAYKQSDPESKRRFWLQHVQEFQTYRTLHADDLDVLAQLSAFFASTTVFTSGPTPAIDAEIKRLELALIDHFGHDDTRELVTASTKIPRRAHTAQQRPWCECSIGSAYTCYEKPGYRCSSSNCYAYEYSCGFGLVYLCDGMCRA